ncbi:hypothetical protein WUBG_16462, partial [Wuchereria bancrofti]
SADCLRILRTAVLTSSFFFSDGRNKDALYHRFTFEASHGSYNKCTNCRQCYHYWMPLHADQTEDRLG